MTHKVVYYFQITKLTLHFKLIVYGLPGGTGHTVLNHVAGDKGRRTGPPRDPLKVEKNVKGTPTI